MTDPATHTAFSVRTATVADAADIAAIYNQAVTETTATLDLVPRTIEQQSAWIAERTGAYCVVVAVADDGPRNDPGNGNSYNNGTSNGTIVGFASLSPYKPRPAYNTTVEDSVYVAPDWAGKGIGRALLGEVITRARSGGFHTMIARIEASSTASRQLHSACGFELVGVEREVGRKFRRWLDMAVMQLMLDGTTRPHQPDES